jgi:SulP family sulfate permease
MIYALFGTSRELSVAPVAMSSLLTKTALGGLGLGTDAQSVELYVGLAAVLALQAGLVRTLMSFFRLGAITNFLSVAVLNGM